jgi:hypothetical protein
VALAGCAVAPPPPPPAPPPPGTQAFTGEVWTWDEQASTVTLRQGDRIVRVRVTPQQLVGLRLHQVVTVWGERAPAELLPARGPVGRLVERGSPDRLETAGTVSGLDPVGAVTVTTAWGTLRLWIAEPGTQPFAPGQPVRVRLRVQPLEVVPAAPGEGAEAAPLAAPLGTEPGEYAILRGRVMAVDPGGRLNVESARGPVTVLVPFASRYRSGDWVEVETAVHPAR